LYDSELGRNEVENIQSKGKDTRTAPMVKMKTGHASLAELCGRKNKRGRSSRESPGFSLGRGRLPRLLLVGVISNKGVYS
jgi:hypothetical protein